MAAQDLDRVRLREQRRAVVVERMSVVLTDAGLPRMPARVFAYALADDADSHNARELADGLRVSPAAISGAVRYLVQVGMLRRERHPGERSDHYALDHVDPWTTMIGSRSPWLRQASVVLEDAAVELGPTTPAGQRLESSRLFFAFMEHDLDGIVERWHAFRDEHDTAVPASVSGRRPAGDPPRRAGSSRRSRR